MRKKVEQLREQMAAFVGQREDFVLVVRSSDADGAVVNKILEGLDEASTSEIFWLVVDEFKDAMSYAEACVRSFSIKHQAARLVLEKQKKPPLPPLPANIAEPSRLPPIERTRQLMIFSRSLLPTLAGCGVVWCFLPMSIHNGGAYAEFMSALWRHELPFPWCHHMRTFVRDSFPDSCWKTGMTKGPRTQECVVDFSPEAIQKALEDEAGDKDTPLADRMNSCLMLAGIDFSHARHERAIQQYDLVHRYAAATQNPTLAAVALNGLAEVKRAQGKVDEAGQFLQAAIAPAAQASSPPVPVLFNTYLNLGELRHSQKRWEEAEVYLHGAGEFALLMRDPGQRLRCWQMLGESQYEQKKVEAALKTWSNGAIVAGKLKLNEDQQEFIQRVRAHYTRQRDENGLKVALQKIQDEIAAGNRQSNAAGADRAATQGRG